MEKTFLHSGDMGDIIVSMCAMRELGGGVLYLDPSGGLTVGEYTNVVRMQTLGKGLKFNHALFDFIKPLIAEQPYVSGVAKYNGEKIDFDLNKFRCGFLDKDTFAKTNGNLFYMNCEAWGYGVETLNQPWVFASPAKVLDRKCLIARSTRCQGGHGFLRQNSLFLEQNAYSIGTKFEQDVLNNALETNIPRYECVDALEVARIVAGAECVISNSTFIFWVALALGHKNILHECCPDVFASQFNNHPHIRNFIGFRCEKEKPT